ncbi:hypothetical protein MNB_SUP05-SYMBIONT-5-169 [hydrothermal vent metagenome]|uniref:HD/PDEase domain-containing protein n=1 Tax=hydrothermal vent metagenome TaxID=652676 RepID=A0A1W1E512_9ZZZZ
MDFRKIINFFTFFTKSNKVDGCEQIQSADVLLLKHKKLIDNIYHQSHVPEEHFKSLYLYSITRLAVWVQDLPASQNHHHSSSGGFLLHTLEVIEIALKQRNNKMLPIGSSVEKQNEKKDLWTFAVFVAALLHDIGKTVSDVNIMLYDSQKKELGRWSPWFGSMSSVEKVRYYQYQYNSNRKYQHHSLLPLSLLSQFINPAAIDWMQKENDLFTLLLMTLQGRSAEGAIIADIVKYADSESSAKSLESSGNNDKAHNPLSPQPKSLADKLLDTMRHLVLETDLKINVPGAVMFTTSTDIYFVSKVIMDKVRDSLDKDKQKGVPFDNSRMMDELLQFHIITPNSEGKAIWSCILSGGGFKKPVNLTMLKMPLEKIYFNFKLEDGKTYSHFSGEIIEEGIVKDDDVKNINTDDNDSNLVQSDSKEENVATTLPLPPGFAITTDNGDNQDKKPQPTQKSEKPLEKTNTDQHQQPILETELGKGFLVWLMQVVNNKAIMINTTQSKVHIVEYKDNKALFLVSPKIFKEYSVEQWAQTQKQFGRLKINLKTHTSENIWQVETKTQRKDKKPSIIRGYLIVNLDGYNVDGLPEPNRYLQLITQQPKNDEPNE